YTALVNIGARQGVRRGMRFIVLRGEQLVGRGRVKLLDADYTYLQITDNYTGVQPQDHVRAIFQLPALPRQRSEVSGEKRVAYEAQQQQPGDQQNNPGDVVQ